MTSSIFGTESGNFILHTMNQLKSAAGGDVRAACDLLDQAGITRTLPNGQQVSASQFAQMMRGRTPEQAFSGMGRNFDEFRSMM